jgi:hypothetical protein
MDEKVFSLKRTARIAGLLYLLNVITSVYGLLFVSSQIVLPGETIPTVSSLIENEFLFRTGIVCRLIGSIPWVLLALVLYRLLKNVNEYQAKLMVAWMIISIPISFLAEAFNITSLMIAKGELLNLIDPAQRQVFIILFLNINNHITLVSAIFWGLWLLPFGLLVYKSWFIPRIFGILIILGGAGYFIESITSLLFPSYKAFTQYTFLLYSAGEISIILWFLIKGVKNKIPSVDRK